MRVQDILISLISFERESFVLF